MPFNWLVYNTTYCMFVVITSPHHMPMDITGIGEKQKSQFHLHHGFVNYDVKRVAPFVRFCFVLYCISFFYLRLLITSLISFNCSHNDCHNNINLFSESTTVCANSLLLTNLKEVMTKCSEHSSLGDLANISPLTDIISTYRISLWFPFAQSIVSVYCFVDHCLVICLSLFVW